jgi:hypothetical protein
MQSARRLLALVARIGYENEARIFSIAAASADYLAPEVAIEVER